MTAIDDKISSDSIQDSETFEEAGILVKHDFKEVKLDMKLMTITII